MRASRKKERERTMQGVPHRFFHLNVADKQQVSCQRLRWGTKHYNCGGGWSQLIDSANQPHRHNASSTEWIGHWSLLQITKSNFRLICPSLYDDEQVRAIEDGSCTS